MLSAALNQVAKKPPKNPLLTAIERATSREVVRSGGSGRRENPLIKLATGKSVMMPTATERAFEAERKRGNNWISDMALVDSQLGPNSEHRELMRSVAVLARTDPDVTPQRAAEIVRNAVGALRRGEVDRVKGFVDDGRKLRAARHVVAEEGRRKAALRAEWQQRNELPTGGFLPQDLEQAIQDTPADERGVYLGFGGNRVLQIGDAAKPDSGPGAMVRYFGKAGAGSDNDALLYLRGVDFISSAGTAARVIDGDARTYDELSDGEKAHELFLNIVPQVAAGILTGGASASGTAAKVAAGVASSMAFDLPGIAVAVKDAGGPVKFATGLKDATLKALTPGSKMSPVDRASVLGTAGLILLGGGAAASSLKGNSKVIGKFASGLKTAAESYGSRVSGLADRVPRAGAKSAGGPSLYVRFEGDPAHVVGRREISTPGRERAFVSIEVRGLDEVQPSHLPDGSQNPKFNSELNASQNRDRSSAAAILRIKQRAKNPDYDELLDIAGAVDRGIPTISGVGEGVAGHGRLMSLLYMREHYPANFREYQRRLAERFPDAVKGVNDPILVQALEDSSPENLARIGRTSNDSAADRLTRFEEARINADRLPEDVEERFTMGASKTLQAAAERRDNEAVVENWIRSLPESERTAARGANGTGISDEYLEKFGQALLLRTLGPDAEKMLSTLFVDNDGPKRILGGLEQASGDLMDLAAAGRRGETEMASEFRTLLGDALGYVQEAMNSKMKNLEWFEQGTLDVRRDSAMRLAKAMVGAHTKAEVAGIVSKVARAAKEAGGGLFGDEVAFKTIDDVVDAAFGDVKIGASAGEQGSELGARGSGLGSADKDSLTVPKAEVAPVVRESRKTEPVAESAPVADAPPKAAQSSPSEVPAVKAEAPKQPLTYRLITLHDRKGRETYLVEFSDGHRLGMNDELTMSSPKIRMYRDRAEAEDAAQRVLAREGGDVTTSRVAEVKRKAGPRADLVTPSEKAMAGTLEVKHGREYFRLEDQADKFEYLTIKETGVRDVADLNKAAKAAMDAGKPKEAAKLTSEAAARRVALDEDIEGFFVEFKRRERIKAGEPDLDAEFASRVSEEAAHAEIEKVVKKSRSKMGGFTTLPVGDLRVLGKALGDLADHAIRKGVAAAEWTADLVKRYGARIKDRAETAWSLARARWIQMGEADRAFRAANPNWTKRGSLFPKARRKKMSDPKSPDYDPFAGIPDAMSEHLVIKGDAETIRRTAGEWFAQAFLSDVSRTGRATKELSNIKGAKLEGSALDLEASVLRQSRVGHKVEDAVLRGVVDDEGKRISMGVLEINDLITKLGIDRDEWVRYKVALRENELYMQQRGGIDGARAKKNDEFVQAFLLKMDEAGLGDALARVEQEWMRLSDAHLGLFERYGLKEEGWSAKIREENSFYFPLFRAKDAVETTMAAINPSSVASPGAKVFRAKGGNEYVDGVAAMARAIERVIREGEAMEGYRPFFDAAAKEPDMAPWVREITKTADEVDDEVTDFATAELEKAFKGPDDPIEGQDPILTLVYDGKKRTFEIDPLLWNAIRGGMPSVENPFVTVASAFSKTARTGTTGKANPLFQLVFNPIIDASSAAITQGVTPIGWIRGLVDAARGVKSANYRAAIRDNAFLNSKGVRDFLDQEWLYDPSTRNKVQRAVDAALEKNGVRVFKSFADFYGRAGQAMEETTRMAAYNKAKAGYLKKGMSELEAGRRAADDSANLMPFNMAGDIPKGMARAGIPYATIPYNVINAQVKAFKKAPAKYLARAAVVLGGPAALEWSLYHDDPEWSGQPDYVRYGSVMFRTGIFTGNPKEGSWFAIRIPQELGLLVRGPLFDALDGKLGTKTGTDAISREVDNFVPSAPTWLALIGQEAYHRQNGGVFDVRFWSQRAYPLTEDSKDSTRAKNAYKQMVQQVDTAFGSMGRYAVRKFAYEQDKGNPKESQRRETRDPNLLQRFMPEPPKGGKGQPKEGTVN